MNRMTNDFRRDTGKNPAELEQEIDATRSELRDTLYELEHRLSPTDLLDTLMSRVRRDGGDFADNLGRSIRDNPVPALLTSIGIVWMMAGTTRTPRNVSHGLSTGRVRGAAHASAGRVRESAHEIRERWHETKDAVRHGGEAVGEGVAKAGGVARDSADAARRGLSATRRHARGVSSAAREGAGRARDGVDYVWHEQPLILGALGLAAGAIAGALLPPTEEEDRVLGDLRDRTLDRAKESGAEQARVARERLEAAAERAADGIREQSAGAEAHSGPAPTF